MSGKGAFAVEGRIVKVRGPGLAEVELANGHRLIGHMRRSESLLSPGLKAGMKVMVELKPYDLSAGWMRLQTD